jgi:hypothetical protein
MSELDTSLAKLRDDLRTTINRPELSRVADRARQRMVRRRMQIGAIVAVVLVSVAVPLLRALPDVSPPATPPRADRSVTYQLDFANASRGYALRSECDDPDGPCAFALLVTADGGRGWQPRKLPLDNEHYSNADLRVQGPDKLLFYPVPTGDEDTMARQFYSPDAGRTWRELPAAVAEGAPTAFSEDTRLNLVCVSNGGECTFGVGTQSPDGSQALPALTQPGLVDLSAGDIATEGDRFWAAGRDPATGRWAVSVTSNGGATWATTPLDLPGKPRPNRGWSVVEHDGVMYTTVEGAIGTGPIELLAVFRSTNDGVSWIRTWQAAGDQRLPAVMGTPIATADGRLLVYSTTEGTFESTDGQTFTTASRQLPGPVRWTKAGYLAQVREGTYEITSDGSSWRRFEVR